MIVRSRQVQGVRRLIWTTLQAFFADDCLTGAAVIAYFTLLSIFPLLLAVLAIVGTVLANTQTTGHLVQAAASEFPGSSTLIATTVAEVSQARGSVGIFATLGLIWSALGLFQSLNQTLSRVWNVPKQRGIIPATLLSLTMVLAVFLVPFLSLLVSTAIALLGQLAQFIPIVGPAAAAAELSVLGRVVPFFLTVLIIALIYKFGPNARVPGGAAVSGALVAAVLFEGGKDLFAWYLAHLARLNTMYGSIGAIIAILTWAYFFAAILLLGAEFGRATTLLGRPRVPLPTPAWMPAEPARREGPAKPQKWLAPVLAGAIILFALVVSDRDNRRPRA